MLENPRVTRKQTRAQTALFYRYSVSLRATLVATACLFSDGLAPAVKENHIYPFC